jgi:WD40 repeat protein
VWASSTGVSFSPNGKLLASATLYISLQLWSVENKTCLLVLPNHHNGVVSSVAFTPDGQTLATARECDISTVCLWNPHEERQRDKQFDWRGIVRLWKS